LGFDFFERFYLLFFFTKETSVTEVRGDDIQIR